MRIPMEARIKHRADFKVSYRFYHMEAGCRQGPPAQGYRSDFWYDDADHSDPNQAFMIWPEFEDAAGMIIEYCDRPIPAVGTARMWIISPAMRSYHQDKIKPGLVGFFMEGSIRVATCEVIEIVDLIINPRVPIHFKGKHYT